MNRTINFDLSKFATFLVNAKKNTYVLADSNKIIPQRLEFKELIYAEKDLEYRDSYCGFFFAPGQEVVRLKGFPIWVMSYSGGMLKEYHPNTINKNNVSKVKFAKDVFNFLKDALSRVDVINPYRGPKRYAQKDWVYKSKVNGTILDFQGAEEIYFKNKLVFKQYYIGGLVINK